MDLTKLDRAGLAKLRDDVETFRGNLNTLGTAADALAEGGLEPEISLTSNETVLRVLPILTYGPDDTPPMLLEALSLSEPLPLGPEIEILPIHPADAPTPTETPSAAPTAAAKTDLARTGTARKVGANTKPCFTEGPFSHDERSKVERLHAEGLSSADIAKQLNRRTQTVSLFVTALKKRRINENSPGASTPKAFIPDAADKKDDTAGQPALAEPKGGQTKVTGPEAEEAKPAAPDAPEAGGASTIAPDVQAIIWPDKLLAHVTDLPRLTGGNRWSQKDDIDLLALSESGLKPHEIAIELGRAAGVVKQRLDLLTGYRKVHVRGDHEWRHSFEPKLVLECLRDRAGVPAE